MKVHLIVVEYWVIFAFFKTPFTIINSPQLNVYLATFGVLVIFLMPNEWKLKRQIGIQGFT